MMNITEAARRCGVSDKTIRRAILAGKLHADYPQQNLAEISEDELQRWLSGQKSKYVLTETVQTPAQTIQELEARVSELETRVQQMETLIADLSARTAKPGKRQLPDLPADLVNLYAVTNLHGINTFDAHNRIKSGAIHLAKGGPWMSRSGRVDEALDQAGQHEFWIQFHNNAEFRSCDDCPHTDRTRE